jgi:hypothetical protein
VLASIFCGCGLNVASVTSSPGAAQAPIKTQLAVTTTMASVYSKTLKASSGDSLQAITSARLDKIKSHLSKSPRGNRLEGKVCVVTGVGSLKGIGYTMSSHLPLLL